MIALKLLSCCLLRDLCPERFCGAGVLDTALLYSSSRFPVIFLPPLRSSLRSLCSLRIHRLHRLRIPKISSFIPHLDLPFVLSCMHGRMYRLTMSEISVIPYKENVNCPDLTAVIGLFIAVLSCLMIIQHFNQ